MKYYCVKQHDETDCGAACIATISKQYGLSLSISKVRAIAGTDKQGTTVYGLVKAVEQLGFTAKGVKGDVKSFFEQFPLPAIAHIVTEDKMLHYVVIHKISKKEVIIADPAYGLKKMPTRQFLGLWTGVLVLMVPEHSFSKGTESEGVFRRFFSLLKPQKRLIVNIFVASLLITALGLAGAFFFQIIIDDLYPAGITKTLHVLAIGIILLNVFQVLLSAFRSQLLLYMSQKLDIELLLGYYHHVLRLPMDFFGTRKVGEIISRFQDATAVRDAISSATLTIMIDTLMAIVGGLILYFQHATLFLIVVAMVVLYGVLVIVFNKRFKAQNKRQMEDNSQLTSYMVESLNGIDTVKAFNGERSVQMQTEFKFVKMLKSIFSLGSTANAQSSLKSIIEMVGRVCILWVGAYSAIQGNMTIGSLVTFNALLDYFLNPVKNLIDLQPQMQTAIVAAERLGEILDLEVEKNDAEHKKAAPESLLERIAFENISFRYGSRRLVLEDLSLSINPGQNIALVGESGSGKTTLAKLLLNFYQCEKGGIKIGEWDVQDIQLDVLREKIAYIPQETFLFSGSIYENLTFGIDNPTMKDVVRCAKIAQIHDFISELPLRYDTNLDENGANLSGGQRQRIAIARALMKKPEILILDEATSNLDAVTENAIQNTLDRFTSGITSIIIAHRLSTIRRCDNIFVIDKGKVVEQGNHVQLIQNNGYYAQLYKSQIAGLDISVDNTETRESGNVIDYSEKTISNDDVGSSKLGELHAAGSARSANKANYLLYKDLMK